MTLLLLKYRTESISYLKLFETLSKRVYKLEQREEFPSSKILNPVRERVIDGEIKIRR